MESDGSLVGPSGRLLGTSSSLKSLRSAVKRRTTRERPGVQRTASKGYLIHRSAPCLLMLPASSTHCSISHTALPGSPSTERRSTTGAEHLLLCSDL